jgi:hypothetical protein
MALVKAMSKNEIENLIKYRQKGETWASLAKKFKGHTANALRKTYYRNIRKPEVKVLIFDIEMVLSNNRFYLIYSSPN